MRYKILFLLALLFCSGCGLGGGNSYYAGKLVKQYGGEKTRPDEAVQRSILLLHSPSGENLNLIYYADGRYKPMEMSQINKLFRDRRTNETHEIDPELIDYLVDIRKRLCLPQSVVFEILSGYRAPETNQGLRQSNKQAAKNSLHLHGWAVDFRIKSVNGKAIAEIAKTMQRGGVSFYPSSNHVHVDLGNIRTWVTK